VKYKLLLLISILLNTVNLFAQMGKLKDKYLKPNEAKEYIAQHHGIKKQDPLIYYCNLYDCDNNTLVIESTKENRFILYYDKIKYYEFVKKYKRLKNERPLAKQQQVIRDIEGQKKILISQLFSQIKMAEPDNLSKVDLKKLNNKLREYGYENAYYNLLLNLIVFCGEYMREQKGGEWILQNDIQHPGEVLPVYMDSTGRRYDFWINNLLIRQYMENERFNIPAIIQSAMLPEIFKAVPNPFMNNPNNR
jgi:hypothetical protein